MKPSSDSRRALTGKILGVYRVQECIGAGGMGEVYRALDTKLGRDVAIKVLPSSYAQDEGRVRRLGREARLLATLNHPNVGMIYGVEDAGGIVALVLELVEGPTLADRLAAGPLPVSEAIAVARQIADGVEAAHEHGIIHRDLKPANIKVRPDGVVKVLDFGVARAAGVEPAGADAPTLTVNGTRAGQIVGTVAYMSPEQARGLPVDKRSDIWAFGCVLYEMLTGRRPFSGATMTDTLAAIVEHEPDWTALPATIPPTVARVLRRCLEKDPKRRVRDIGDARNELESRDEAPMATPAGVARPRRRTRFLWMAAALMAGAGFGWMAAGSLFRVQSTAAPLSLFTEVLPGERTFPPGGNTSGTMVALSPTGNRLVYIAQQGPEQRLFTRALDRLDEVDTAPIGEARAREPFFSPDGEWLGYRTGLTLKRMSVRGGPAETVAVLPAGVATIQGISWSPDNTILVGAGGMGVLRVPVGGAAVETLVAPAKARFTWYPQALPGGRAVLYTESDGTPEKSELVLFDVTAGTTRTLRSGSAGRYLPTGHLVFVAGGTLFAVQFDLERLEVRGTAVPIIKGIRVNPEGGAVQVALTDTGTLAYLPAASSFQRTLVWVDGKGKATEVGAPPRAYANPRVSPDGTRILVTMKEGGEDVFIWDVDRRILRQLTFDPTSNPTAVWLDDKRVAFAGTVDGWSHVFLQTADGLATATQLTSGVPAFPLSASKDGNLLFLSEYPPDAGWDISVVPVQNPGARQTVDRTKTLEHNPVLSPDGRWLAYQSNKTGRSEIYVRAFPLSGAPELPVTAEGGSSPVWARDGTELYYWTESKGVVAIRAIGVTPGPPSGWGAPRTVVSGPYVSAGTDSGYDVWGGRFLLMKNFAPDGTTPRQGIVVAQHWLGELTRLAPR